MILQKLFENNGYTSILNIETAIQYNLFVDMFYDEDGKVPKELINLYISKTYDELFFVLDSKEHDISELCTKWDQKISAFMAFGSTDSKIIRKLKYNVIQVILYQGDIEDRSEEGSLNISRKILIPFTLNSEGDIEISDGEIIEIPFYLIESGDFVINQEIWEKLNDCLPGKEKKELEFLGEKRKRVSKINEKDNILRKNFRREEYDNIKEWLNTNDNTVNQNRKL